MSHEKITCFSHPMAYSLIDRYDLLESPIKPGSITILQYLSIRNQIEI